MANGRTRTTSVFMRYDGQGAPPVGYVVVHDDTGRDVRDTGLSTYFTITNYAGEKGMNAVVTISPPDGRNQVAAGAYRIHSVDRAGNLSSGCGRFRVEPDGSCLVTMDVSGD